MSRALSTNLIQGKDMSENKGYKCEDCVACKKEDSDEIIYKCKFDGEELNFDVTTKTPCNRFIPADYIESLNYDTR